MNNQADPQYKTNSTNGTFQDAKLEEHYFSDSNIIQDVIDNTFTYTSLVDKLIYLFEEENKQNKDHINTRHLRNIISISIIQNYCMFIEQVLAWISGIKKHKDVLNQSLFTVVFNSNSINDNKIRNLKKSYRENKDYFLKDFLSNINDTKNLEILKDSFNKLFYLIDIEPDPSYINGNQIRLVR